MKRICLNLATLVALVFVARKALLFQLQWLLSETSAMRRSMKNVKPDPDFSYVTVSCFPSAVRAPFHSPSSFFFCPLLVSRCSFSFVVLLNKDVQRVLRRSPQAPAGVGAVAPPAPLPLIAADAAVHLNVSVELER